MGRVTRGSFRVAKATSKETTKASSKDHQEGKPMEIGEVEILLEGTSPFISNAWGVHHPMWTVRKG